MLNANALFFNINFKTYKIFIDLNVKYVIINKIIKILF